jgi:nucleotide-binding universal stress UspA family protein
MEHPGSQKLPIRRILFATDYSENSRLALDYAVTFAQRFDAAIYMLHVVLLSQAAHEAEIAMARSGLSREAAERRLETLAEGVRHLGLTVETHVIEGFAAEVIPQSVLTYDIDLLVLGIHGLHRSLTYFLMGSTTESLLRDAPCPVLTVGASVLSGFKLKEHLDHILYVSDFSPEGVGAASYALALAEAVGVPVHLASCFPENPRQDPKERSDAVEDYCRILKKALPARQSDWGDPAFQLSHALRSDELIQQAAQEREAVIVLGIRSLHTHFARHLLSRAGCPVITVSCLRAP